MSFLKNIITSNLKNLYIHRSILILANSFFGIFGIIFIYKLLNENIKNLTIFSLLGSLGYVLLLPFLKNIIHFRDFRTMIIIGTILNTILFISYWATSYFTISWGWILILFSLIFLRITYWVPMHTELIDSSEKINKGSVIATILIITNIIGIASPIICGMIIEKSGFNLIFLIGVVISILAIFPILKLTEKNKKEVTWNSTKIIKEFINKKNRNFILALISMGVENSVAIIVWPIFIFELLQGDFLKIGILSTGVTIVVIILNLVQGKLSKKNKLRQRMMKYGTFTYSFGWFLRIFATTAIYIFIIDIYQRMVKGFSFLSFDAFVYDYMADQGNLVDEYTILREIALHLGKIIGYILIIIGSIYLPLNYLFILAIIATLTLNILPTEKDGHGNIIA